MPKASPLLILTPLPVELKALMQALAVQSEAKNVGSTKVHWLESGSVALAIGGHGKVNFALTTQELIQALKPQLVCAVGSGGSLQSHVRPGDIVVAETIIEHDHLVRFFAQPLPSFAADQETLKRVRGFSATNFSIHFGAIASGDEDIIEESRAKDVQARTKALAVAWEGAGLARACQRTNTPFVEIRAITDMASGSVVQDFAENLKTGMTHLGQVIRSIFTNN